MKKDPAKTGKIQLILITLASLGFAAFYDPVSAVILMLASCITYFAGLKIEILKGKKKKICFVTAVVFLVLLLAFFKYSKTILGVISLLWHKEGVHPDALALLLPLGISFYVFTSIGYLADLYNGKYTAERSFIKVTLFLSFFPKLISGPIVRGDDFFPQLENYEGVRMKNVCEGMQILLFGLLKKLVLANRLGLFVDDVFYAPVVYDSPTVLLAIISYSFQIYLDFSGYSDMAVGLARIFGIRIAPNFDLPYLSTGSSEFWQRWHISLSSWLRDYVYIPLGGSKRGNLSSYVNLMIVMLVSGIWHGTGLTFLLWGFLHGIWACIDRMIRKCSKGQKPAGRIFGTVKRALSILLSYITASILWVFFRADSLDNAKTVLLCAFSGRTGISQQYVWSYIAALTILAATVIAVIRSHLKTSEKQTHGFYPLLDLTTIKGLTIFFFLIGIIILFGYFGNTAFIYGNF